MLSHRFRICNGVRFHLVEAGIGPPVILLHGFPEFWYSWRHQIPALAEAGFRVIAPDLRGYNESAKPPGIRNYRLSLLIEDVAALIADAGARRAAVVGHDWGGVIAWLLATHRPELVDRLAILNAPHPAAFRRELRHRDQRWRSWYILFFQLPVLPEWLLAAGDYALVPRMLARTVRAGAFTAHDIRLYQRALARPGARTASLNYYRAAWSFRETTIRQIHPISAPTLLIWGEKDRYLSVGLTKGLDKWVPNLRIERLPDAGHWVQNEAPDAVNRLLRDFLQLSADANR
jgi:pimeloyl-ACP methyl ester carboxylesterase